MELRGVGRFSQPWLGWDWWALVGVGGRATPAHPRKDGTSHQICPNDRFGSDLV
ncbi:hypothetical protein FRC0129_00150 [Corynebacterium diphtheriae]|nr:hypothetical protein CIP107549_00157 [Corynebacterium diphtheriae]CAB0730994.1 hypothetical protein FRC0129_00150 [Corynebacterium diphtheriae]